MRPRMSKAARRSCRVHKWRLVANYKAHYARKWWPRRFAEPQEVEQCAYCGVERVAKKGGAK